MLMPLPHLRLVVLVSAAGMLAFTTLVGPSCPAAAQAPTQVKQIKLTERQVRGFIAAQKDMSAVTAKMQGSSPDQPDPKIQKALEAVSKKHGFKDSAEYGDVAANISMVMAGIDPDTKQFTDAPTALRHDIAAIESDTTIAAQEKKQMLDEMNKALKAAASIEHPENVALVMKFYEKIDAVLQ
jgi:hypothetical protein